MQKILSGMQSECQMVWIQIRNNILSFLIWVQTVRKGYQQTSRHHNLSLAGLGLRMIPFITDVIVAKKNRPFACRFCPKRFPSQYQVMRHERIHTGEKPYKCDLCGRCFNAKGNMRAHRVTHVNEKILWK